MTVDWKTYTSTHGFSFKYPSTWIQRSKGEGCGPVFAPADNSLNGWLTVCGPYVNTGETPENLSVRPLQNSSLTLVSKKIIQVDGSSGVKVVIRNSTNKIEINSFFGRVATSTLHPDGTKEQPSGPIGLYFYLQDSLQQDAAEKIYDQILSTFKFTQ